jgi:putative two-component system response regulator
VRVLVADDHEMVREGVKAVLRLEDGIEIVGEAENGLDALRLARELMPDAMIVDNRMPGLSGLEVARRVIRDLPKTAVVMLTFDADVRDLALAAGVSAVVLKGAPSGELVRAVRGLAGKPKRRSPGRRERDRLYADSVIALSGAIEAKQAGPIEIARLAGAARRLAERLGRGDVEAERIELAVLLRDIGKVGLPESILTKRGPLEPAERQQLRSHVALGTEILAESEALRDVAPFVRHHHEHVDGSGYPDGLAGDAIPLGAQIVGLLDAYNGIVSPRSYKQGFPSDFAIKQLALSAGRDFSESLVTALFDLSRTEPGYLTPVFRSDRLPGPVDTLTRLGIAAIR